MSLNELRAAYPQLGFYTKADQETARMASLFGRTTGVPLDRPIDDDKVVIEKLSNQRKWIVPMINAEPVAALIAALR